MHYPQINPLLATEVGTFLKTWNVSFSFPYTKSILTNPFTLEFHLLETTIVKNWWVRDRSREINENQNKENVPRKKGVRGKHSTSAHSLEEVHPS